MTALMDELRAGRTDLARIVERVTRRARASVVVSPAAVAGWSAREPEAWPRLKAWLNQRGVEIREP